MLGINRKARSLKQILLYGVFGFTDFKLKLSGQIVQYIFAVTMLPAVEIRSLRFDANNLFNGLDAAKDLSLSPWKPSQLELLAQIESYLTGRSVRAGELCPKHAVIDLYVAEEASAFLTLPGLALSTYRFLLF